MTPTPLAGPSWAFPHTGRNEREIALADRLELS